MEFEYSNKWHGISKVNINAGDTWEYLGITNKYLNTIFYKIDDGKKDENGYREVSEEELSLLENLLQKARGISGRLNSNRFFDKELAELERQIDEGKIELPNRIQNNNIDDDESQWKENVIGFNVFTYKELKELIEKGVKEEELLEMAKNRIQEELNKYHDYDARFPEGKYYVEVIYDGKYYQSFVYDKEFESYKKSDPKKLERAVNEFRNGNFDAINTIENPVEFMETFRKKNGGKSMFSALISSYQDGKLSSEKLQEYMRTLEKRFTEYEQEYKKVNSDDKFDTADTFWNEGTYSKLSDRVNDYIQSTEHMQYKYEQEKLDKKQVQELQQFVKDNYNIELNEYVTARIIEQGTRSDYGIYEFDFEKVKKQFENLSEQSVNFYTRPVQDETIIKDDIDINEIKELQKLFKERYKKDMSEDTAVHWIKVFKGDGWKSLFRVGFNLEQLKQDFLNGKIFEESGVKDFQDYLNKRIIWRGVVENDNIEILEELAQATEQEYGRYKFDIKKSPVADLARQSDKMRAKAEKELKVTKTDDKIVIYNKSTKEERVIDLNKMTSKLDDKHKQNLLGALEGFNKLSLWEFAVEAANSIDIKIHDEKHSLAEYNIEEDTININNITEQKVDSYTLLHEMCHAMMATIADGKNVTNEKSFKELVDTFEEEQNAYREKRFRNGSVDGSNYTYCAQNIMEFAAESGCLWLSGKSKSEFTIATHFPKSYKLVIQLIEKIRTQETGRSVNS